MRALIYPLLFVLYEYSRCDCKVFIVLSIQVFRLSCTLYEYISLCTKNRRVQLTCVGTKEVRGAERALRVDPNARRPHVAQRKVRARDRARSGARGAGPRVAAAAAQRGVRAARGVRGGAEARLLRGARRHCAGARDRAVRTRVARSGELRVYGERCGRHCRLTTVS